jgi:hypothetical protein
VQPIVTLTSTLRPEKPIKMSRPISILSSSALVLLAGLGVAHAQPDEEAPADEEPVADPAPVEEEAPAEPPVTEEVLETTAALPEAPAEEEASGFALAGFVNTTYNYNFGRPASGGNTLFSYNAQHNSLLLNAAHLALTGSVSDALSWTVELDFGADAQVNTYAATPMPVDVQEAYGVYTKGKLGVKIGKFVTYQGIEVIESPANPTISRGLLFGLAEAFYHTGAVLTYQVSDKADLAVGVIQGWDVLYDTNRGKMGVVKVGLAPSDKFALTLSTYVGPDLAGNDDDFRISADATGVFKPSDKLDIWFQGNFGTELTDPSVSWFGAGVQPVIRLSDTFALGARAEFFKDEGARTGADQTLINISAAPTFTIAPGFIVRVEGRVDISSEDVFEDSDGAGKGNQIVGLADATFAF